MGCAASTTAHTVPGSGAHPSLPRQHLQQQPSQPALPAARVLQAAPRLQQEAARDIVKTAPLVKSLVSLQRNTCAVERDQQGCHFTFSLSALASGEAKAFFLARGADLGSSFGVPDAEQVPSQSFLAGKLQSCRLFLCDDLGASLKNFADEKDKHHLVLDLRVDTNDQQCVTAQRTLMRFTEGDALQITKQVVQCGEAVHCLDPLYGTLPNPQSRSGPGAADSEGRGGGESEGGDCVICLSKRREVVILHCRHVCLCRSCAQITSSTWSHQCPVCRGRVAAMVSLEEYGK